MEHFILWVSILLVQRLCHCTFEKKKQKFVFKILHQDGTSDMSLNKQSTSNGAGGCSYDKISTYVLQAIIIYSIHVFACILSSIVHNIHANLIILLDLCRLQTAFSHRQQSQRICAFHVL